MLWLIGFSSLGIPPSWPHKCLGFASSLESPHLPSGCLLSDFWATSKQPGKALPPASQAHSVFSSFETVVKVWSPPKGISWSETCIFNKLYLSSMMGKLLSRLTANGMRKWKNTLRVDISWQIREKFSELEAIEKEMQIKIWCFYLSAYSGETINITVNSGIFITTWLECLEKLALSWKDQSLQLWTKPGPCLCAEMMNLFSGVFPSWLLISLFLLDKLWVGLPSPRDLTFLGRVIRG